MTKMSLRTASIVCLLIWAAIWMLFLLLRFSPLDIGRIPGAGMVMLMALGIALLAPILASLLAGVALIRRPRAPLNLLTFGCAMAALVGQALLFLVTTWM